MLLFQKDLSRLMASPEELLTPNLAKGIVAGTLVETASGWKTVEDLRAGDDVQTFDGGLRRIVAIYRSEILPGEPVIAAEGGCLGNCSETFFMPRQGVLLDTFEILSSPYVRVPASALTTVIGVVGTRSHRRQEVVTPVFECEEVVWAQTGLLLYCPGVREQETSFPELLDEPAERFVQERQKYCL